MRTPLIGPGMIVHFRSKVFYEPGYVPFYDAYEGHTFQVLAVEDGHCELECVDDPTIIVQGRVHDDVLKQA